MNVGLMAARITAGLALISLVAACSAGAGPTAPAGDSQASIAASATPDASTPASIAPSLEPPSSSGPTDAPIARGGGGRYGTGATPTPDPTTKPTPKATPKPAPTLTIKSGSTSLGTVLVTSDGLTLYVLAGDSATHSTCTADCASAWPPLLVKAGTKVKGGTGVHAAFTTFKRGDGGTQVAYKGHPLYSWTGDSYPGDTTGDGVGGFSVARV